MPTEIQHIVVVGGGTAGWISAAYLNRAVQGNIQITVVESPQIPRIGVGEATVPTLRDTFRFLGLEERDWMKECNASYKLGIKFVNWLHGPDSQKKDQFFHPFFSHPGPELNPYEAPWFTKIGQSFPLVQYWMQEYARGNKTQFGALAGPIQQLCEEQKSPNPLSSSNQQNFGLNYAYHLDATLMANMLMKVAKDGGVKHVQAEILDVKLDEGGAIQSLLTADQQHISGDFFIDCTGFRSLLIGKFLKEPYIDSNESLLCDSAVAMPCVSDPANDGLNPYTTATALSSGWSWEVPLMHREGSGYVYSSAHLSKDQAESELRQHLGEKSNGADSNHIKMRVGRFQRGWVRNVAAIGLSNSFVEPLESTTIFLIEFQLASLVNHFPASKVDPIRSKVFNETTSAMYDDIRDFIVLHYILSKRQDSDFWKRVKAETVVPPSLKEKIERFKAGVLTPDGLGPKIFETRSYACIMSGMDCGPENCAPILDCHQPEVGQDFLLKVRDISTRMASAMPSHYDYLSELYSQSH